MEYLTSDDIYEMNVIDFNGEKLLLLSSAGETFTFIDVVNDDRDDGRYIDTDAKVFIKQRWKVDILPNTKFDKIFRTHRYINFYYCTYGELIKEQNKIYVAFEVLNNKRETGYGMDDNFEHF